MAIAPFTDGLSAIRKGLFSMFTKDDVSQLTDEELRSLNDLISAEMELRKKQRARFVKADLARANKASTICPYCGGKPFKDGKRHDGIQNYECSACHMKYSDSVATSLASSKLDEEKIRNIITLICLDCPDWVISVLCKVNVKTAQYWADRCLNSSMEWAKNNILRGTVFIDEMQFAPVRSGADAYVVYTGKLVKNLHLEIALDTKGACYAHAYLGNKGHPSGRQVLECLGGKIEKESVLVHDGSPAHNMLIKELSLTDDWHKFVAGEETYERKMKLLSNCCSYLRHSFESHRGIKASKIEAYADFFMFRWSLTRKMGLKKTIEALFNMVCGVRKNPNFTA